MNTRASDLKERLVPKRNTRFTGRFPDCTETEEVHEKTEKEADGYILCTFSSQGTCFGGGGTGIPGGCFRRLQNGV